MKARLESFLRLIESIGGETDDLVFAPPTTEHELGEVEGRLGYRIPEDFRTVLLTISSHCEFKWFLPDDFELPSEIDEIFSGELHWGIDFILPFNEGKDGWIKEVFTNPNDEYDKVWYNKFAIQEVSNGDCIAIDLTPATYGKVVYLSHDDGAGHGYVMADSFYELLDKWVVIGCPGGEDWQWLPFCQNQSSGINPDSQNALLWKKAIGL